MVTVRLGFGSCKFCAGRAPTGVIDGRALCICAALIKGTLTIVLSVFYDVAAVSVDESRALTVILLVCR